MKPAHPPHLGQITGESQQPTYPQVLMATQGPPNLLLHLSFTDKEWRDQTICGRFVQGHGAVAQPGHEDMCPRTGRHPWGYLLLSPSPAVWLDSGSAPLVRVSHGGRDGAGWARQGTGC